MKYLVEIETEAIDPIRSPGHAEGGKYYHPDPLTAILGVKGVVSVRVVSQEQLREHLRYAQQSLQRLCERVDSYVPVVEEKGAP